MDLKIPPIIQVLIFGAIIWLIDRWVPVGQFDSSWRIGIALLLLISGIFLGYLGVSTFQKANTTVKPEHPEKASHIVKGGIYSRTRNPMYLGLALMLMAWSLYLGNFIGLFVVALFVAYITKFQIMPEERILTEKFGQDYQGYQAQVRRWF